MTGDAGWIEAFLEVAVAERSAALNTCAAYRRDLSGFESFLRERGTSLSSAGRDDIEAYASSLARAGAAPSTRARKLSAIRQLYKFAFESGFRSDMPALDVRSPKLPRTLPGTLSLKEVEAMIAAARSHGRNAYEKLRNACLLELLYATGMRVSELVELPAAGVRGNPRAITVKGKGGKERMVPLSGPSRKALSEWLRVRDEDEERRSRPGGAQSRHLFPSRGKLGHVTRVRAYTLIKEIAASAGIDPEKVTPHKFRHAVATHLLANGADLISIQTLLGHADVGTTEIYTHVVDERLKSLVLEHHPLAKDS